MKKLFLFASITTIGLTALRSSAEPVPTDSIKGPITIAWNVLKANLVDVPQFPGAGKTTTSGTGAAAKTNILQIFKNSFTATPFNNASMLKMLSSSLNTTFPTGSKLEVFASGGSKIFVVDPSGTNGTDVSSVLTAPTEGSVNSGVRTQTTTIKSTGTTQVTSGNGAGDQLIMVTYNDAAAPNPGGNNFTFTAVSAFANSSTTTATLTGTEVITEKGSETFAMHGVGSGTMNHTNVIIQGTITGSFSGNFTFSIP